VATKCFFINLHTCKGAVEILECPVGGISLGKPSPANPLLSCLLSCFLALFLALCSAEIFMHSYDKNFTTVVLYTYCIFLPFLHATHPTSWACEFLMRQFCNKNYLFSLGLSQTFAKLQFA